MRSVAREVQITLSRTQDIAEELGTNLVFTTDRKDFASYSIKGRRRFGILPG